MRSATASCLPAAAAHLVFCSRSVTLLSVSNVGISFGADELFKNVEEMWEQYDSKHPVAKAVGNWHLSGFELKKAQVISPTAEVIGMTMSMKPDQGIVHNN